MPIPSPSDLCWNVNFASGQEWIEATAHAAIKTIWQRAQNTARSHFGDEFLAVEMMEVAIEKLVDRLNKGSPVDPAEASILLLRFFCPGGQTSKEWESQACLPRIERGAAGCRD